MKLNTIFSVLTPFLSLTKLSDLVIGPGSYLAYVALSQWLRGGLSYHNNQYSMMCQGGGKDMASSRWLDTNFVTDYVVQWFLGGRVSVYIMGGLNRQRT